MTSIPQLPGAPAVILYREVLQDDSNKTWDYYMRVKILTEGGRDLANIELPATGLFDQATYNNIAGRTIQPDGSIVAFSGKPYEKLVSKGKGFKVKAKVFTLPGAQVGSILEYRYRKNLGDGYQDPNWFVQSSLYILKEHYMWKPTGLALTDPAGGKTTNAVAWMPYLPAGAQVVSVKKHGYNEISLDLQNVAPLPEEEHTPPIESLGFRVLFYYTAYKSKDDFWTGAGKAWSDSWNKFIGPGPLVKKATVALLTAGESDEAKLNKIYNTVVAFENTDYARTMTEKESKNAGYKEVDTTDDLLQLKRGSDRQITALFVAMARAAGFKAYLMGVANRTQRIFLQPDLNLRQLDDLIAIVSVQGKEVFFDPGTLYCQVQHLAWQHANAGGLRQTETGTALFTTPSEPFTDNRVTRLADLSVTADGQATGIVILTYTGDPALGWRQRSARGDEASLKTELRADLEASLPPGMEVTVTGIENLKEREQPLKVSYSISGPVGASTGKRLLLPADPLESNAKAVFINAKRELPVDLHYSGSIQDAVRYKLAPGLGIESVPKAASERYENFATFNTSSLQTPGVPAITLRRNFNLGRSIYAPSQYAGLRAFYIAADQSAKDVLVLIRATPQAQAPGKP